MSVPTDTRATAGALSDGGRAPRVSRLGRGSRAVIAAAAATTLALGLTPALAQAQPVGTISPESVAND